MIGDPVNFIDPTGEQGLPIPSPICLFCHNPILPIIRPIFEPTMPSVPVDCDSPSKDECEDVLDDCIDEIMNGRDPHDSPFGTFPGDEDNLRSCIERKKKGCYDFLRRQK